MTIDGYEGAGVEIAPVDHRKMAEMHRAQSSAGAMKRIDASLHRLVTLMEDVSRRQHSLMRMFSKLHERLERALKRKWWWRR